MASLEDSLSDLILCGSQIKLSPQLGFKSMPEILPSLPQYLKWLASIEPGPRFDLWLSLIRYTLKSVSQKHLNSTHNVDICSWFFIPFTFLHSLLQPNRKSTVASQYFVKHWDGMHEKNQTAVMEHEEVNILRREQTTHIINVSYVQLTNCANLWQMKQLYSCLDMWATMVVACCTHLVQRCVLVFKEVVYLCLSYTT